MYREWGIMYLELLLKRKQTSRTNIDRITFKYYFDVVLV